MEMTIYTPQERLSKSKQVVRDLELECEEVKQVGENYRLQVLGKVEKLNELFTEHLSFKDSKLFL